MFTVLCWLATFGEGRVFVYLPSTAHTNTTRALAQLPLPNLKSDRPIGIHATAGRRSNFNNTLVFHYTTCICIIMEAPKDDFKWFGEGFDGFPKRLAEDSVEYTLFIVNSELSQREVLSRLEEVKKEAAKVTTSLLKEYIWQREKFSLKLVQQPGKFHISYFLTWQLTSFQT